MPVGSRQTNDFTVLTRCARECDVYRSAHSPDTTETGWNDARQEYQGNGWRGSILSSGSHTAQR